MTVETILKYLAGPLIGAVIGYFTNYLAVRMLFRPRTEKYLFGHRLPLTPGAIPKGKARLAKAAGQIVSSSLVTEEDIAEQILSEKLQKAVVDRIMKAMDTDLRSDLSLVLQSEARYEDLREKVADGLTEQIIDAIHDMDVGPVLSEEIAKAIRRWAVSSLFGMFVNDKLIDSITAPMEEEVLRFLDERGRDYIRPAVAKKLVDLEQKSPVQILENWETDRDGLEQAVTRLYQRVVRSAVPSLTQHFDIAGIIEDKINAMNVEELETMVLAVMKKELDTIVRLGALIGFLLGLFNLLINFI